MIVECVWHLSWHEGQAGSASLAEGRGEVNRVSRSANGGGEGRGGEGDREKPLLTPSSKTGPLRLLPRPPRTSRSPVGRKRERRSASDCY